MAVYPLSTQIIISGFEIRRLQLQAATSHKQSAKKLCHCHGWSNWGRTDL